jgi:hypothetical protein
MATAMAAVVPASRPADVRYCRRGILARLRTDVLSWRWKRLGYGVVDRQRRLFGTINVFGDLEHVKGMGAVARPPIGDGIYGAGEEKEESQDGRRRAKKEEPEGELPTTV